MTDIIRQSHRVLSTHARSFRFAAWFLPADVADEVAVLYAFCRMVDDLADEGDDDQAARVALERVRDELDGTAPARALVAAMGAFGDLGMPMAPAHDLIDGALSDLGGVVVADDEALITYSYRVAGTVGLMMAALCGTEDPDARRPAKDLGIAMQITNICRDVAEDAERGRVYLPASRLLAAGTSAAAVLQGTAPRGAIASVVLDLLDLADRYYASGRAGLGYLPLRTRVAVAVAARVYGAIGTVLRTRQGDPMRGRAWVPWHGKLRMALRALTDVPWRARRPAT